MPGGIHHAEIGWRQGSFDQFIHPSLDRLRRVCGVVLLHSSKIDFFFFNKLLRFKCNQNSKINCRQKLRMWHLHRAMFANDGLPHLKRTEEQFLWSWRLRCPRWLWFSVQDPMGWCQQERVPLVHLLAFSMTKKIAHLGKTCPADTKCGCFAEKCHHTGHKTIKHWKVKERAS